MEVKLEGKLRTRIIALKGLCLKWVATGTRGVPDRIVLMPNGKIYFVELKFGKNGLSPQQKLMQRLITALGFKVYNIWNEQQLEEFILCLQNN